MRYAHPFQCWQIQLVGSAILVACVFLFVLVHVNLAENWSPEPEQKASHALVTHGVFRWARHPMYAVFLWASIGTLLATLNWVVCLAYVVATAWQLQRIPEEERILTSLFPEEYPEYRARVPALGAHTFSVPGPLVTQ